MKESHVYSLDEAITARNGLYIARKDYSISEDIELKDGTIFRRGKQYFTKSEILSLQNAKILPYGWDLPTYNELRAIAEEFGVKDGNRHTNHLMTSLGLGMYGSLISAAGFAQYNKAPLNSDYCIAGYNLCGYYLGRVDNPNDACLLCLYGGEGNFVVTPCVADAAASVRLVFRAFSDS